MKRLGILTPSSNTVLEPETARLAAPLAASLSVHVARFRVTRIAPDAGSDEQFDLAPMLEAASLLADARVDTLLWSGTSAAWLGLDADRDLVAAIEGETGIPATTSTLALLDAFAGLGVRRYGLVVPYVDEIADAIVRNLEAEGYECTARTAESVTTNWAFAEIGPATIAERARSIAASRPDAIVVHCTNLRGAAIVEELEDELGIPVLDSVVVGLWGALRLLHLGVPSRGFGRLAGAGPRDATSPRDAAAVTARG
ncbi:MAG TPA: aspartate/glutamate racemase family protein [Candidatus Limnocylindrales bacterium]|nr:aspartate/glutamate racemase family protein [Candidatus Limnocylindrales bacterium]